MSPYKVMVDDTFHDAHEDERFEYGTYPTAEVALENAPPARRCKALFERCKAFGGGSPL